MDNESREERQNKISTVPIRRSNQNVQIVGERTLKIISFGQILRAVNRDGRKNVRRVDKSQDQIIAT